jgi:hypothetical protein
MVGKMMIKRSPGKENLHGLAWLLGCMAFNDRKGGGVGPKAHQTGWKNYLP